MFLYVPRLNILRLEPVRVRCSQDFTDFPLSLLQSEEKAELIDGAEAEPRCCWFQSWRGSTWVTHDRAKSAPGRIRRNSAPHTSYRLHITYIRYGAWTWRSCTNHHSCDVYVWMRKCAQICLCTQISALMCTFGTGAMRPAHSVPRTDGVRC